MSKPQMLKKQLKLVRQRQVRDQKRELELQKIQNELSSDSDDDLNEYQQVADTQFALGQLEPIEELVANQNVQMIDHGSDSDYNAMESPVKKAKKSGKNSRKKQDPEEEEKDNEVYKSSMMTRSGLKALRAESEMMSQMSNFNLDK